MLTVASPIRPTVTGDVVPGSSDCLIYNTIMDISDADLPLFVPVQPFLDFFSCPICMEALRNTAITNCGHRFCLDCIEECVGRLHKCPICNKRISRENIFRDTQFTSLIDVFSREKQKSENKYFDNIINTVCSSEDRKPGEQIPNEFSPVEQVLKKHLKQSLAVHEKYYQDLKKECHKSECSVKADYQQKMEDLQRQGILQEEFEQQLKDLQQTQERHLEKLRMDLDSCGQMVAEAYDKYLGEHIPPLAVLPVNITITLLSKNISISDVQLKPDHSTNDLVTMVEAHMESRGDKVVNLDGISWICFGPFSRKSVAEMALLAKDIVEGNVEHSDVTLLPQNCRPLLQFCVKPGSEIVLHGKVQCESDLPRQCFASTFRQDVSQTMDYFSCRDCGFNWVCRSCMEVCHKDHTVTPYIMRHQPTWACCYCPKKKKCVINIS